MTMMVLGLLLLAISVFQYVKPESKLVRFANRGSKDTSDIPALKSNALMGLTTGVVFIVIGVIARVLTAI
ncbi:hypothetical protein MKX42_32370 [Paenibacillus sp. FSL R7-0204]|uniref:hypothetical protein n=1 Tax=unclassified Paenibacillus TaxID=185978 RepID=UPI0030FB1FD0